MCMCSEREGQPSERQSSARRCDESPWCPALVFSCHGSVSFYQGVGAELLRPKELGRPVGQAAPVKQSIGEVIAARPVREDMQSGPVALFAATEDQS